MMKKAKAKASHIIHTTFCMNVLKLIINVRIILAIRFQYYIIIKKKYISFETTGICNGLCTFIEF